MNDKYGVVIQQIIAALGTMTGVAHETQRAGEQATAHLNETAERFKREMPRIVRAAVEAQRPRIGDLGQALVASATLALERGTEELCSAITDLENEARCTQRRLKKSTAALVIFVTLAVVAALCSVGYAASRAVERLNAIADSQERHLLGKRGAALVSYGDEIYVIVPNGHEAALCGGVPCIHIR